MKPLSDSKSVKNVRKWCDTLIYRLPLLLSLGDIERTLKWSLFHHADIPHKGPRDQDIESTFLVVLMLEEHLD
jgi:hypothetical protein